MAVWVSKSGGRGISAVCQGRVPPVRDSPLLVAGRREGGGGRNADPHEHTQEIFEVRRSESVHNLGSAKQTGGGSEGGGKRGKEGVCRLATNVFFCKLYRQANTLYSSSKNRRILDFLNQSLKLHYLDSYLP